MDVGRLLIIGFEQSAWDEALAALFREVRPGGAIFFNRNTEGGRDAFRDLVARAREALRPPALLVADVEGGTVDRLRDLVGPFPSARSAAAAHDDPLLRRFGALVGEALGAFGLNADLAPVLDVAPQHFHPDQNQREALAGDRPAHQRWFGLGSRASSDVPAEVARFGRNFLEGLSGHGVLGCGKHFPGLGAAPVDTHAELAVVEKSAEKLWEEDLLPFRELARELPLVMVGHAFYPALEPEGAAPRPASMSPAIIQGLLREKVGFRGLVLSDDLEMGGALAEPAQGAGGRPPAPRAGSGAGRSIGEAAVAAVEAGCQLLLVCRRAENIRAARQALLERAARDQGFAARVDEAARQVESFLAERLREEPAPGAGLGDLDRRIEHLRKTVEGMEALEMRVPVPAGAGFVRPGRRGGGGRGGSGGGGGRGRRGDRGRRREGGRGPAGREGRGGHGPHRPRGPRPPRRGD